MICRWIHEPTGLVLDAMPADASILGFAARWQSEAVPHAVSVRLPSGTHIAAVPPPFLVATKLEAFASRGVGDYWGSRDFADVVSLVDGRAEIVAEVAAAPRELRAYLAKELDRHRANPRFEDVPPDPASQDRAQRVVAAL